jgi:hypothetical protein
MINWESADANRLRDYLKKTQFKLTDFLKSRIPRIDGKTIEEVALQAKYKEGFETALRELDELAIIIESKDDPSSGTFTTM